MCPQNLYDILLPVHFLLLPLLKLVHNTTNMLCFTHTLTYYYYSLLFSLPYYYYSSSYAQFSFELSILTVYGIHYNLEKSVPIPHYQKLHPPPIHLLFHLYIITNP